MSPSQRAKSYRRALEYLDRCAHFGESQLREANRIAGSPLTEEDIQRFLHTAGDVLPTSRSPGGMEFVRQEMRKSLAEGIEVFGSLGREGVGSKAGCMGVLALLSVAGALGALLVVW
jgi:hypothetical protein